MNITYHYEDPTDKEDQEFDSLEEFLKYHPIYSQMLGNGRSKFEQEIRLTNYDEPFIAIVRIEN